MQAKLRWPSSVFALAFLIFLTLPKCFVNAQATSTAPARQAPPAGAVAARKQQMIHELFKEEYARKAAADRLALAKKLESEALATRDDLDARYVLLMEASDLAAGAGDVELALRALDEAATTHMLNLLDAKLKVITRVQTLGGTPEASEALTRAALNLADVAVAADAFDTVKSLTGIAEDSANKTRRISFVASVQPRLAELRALATEFASVQLALKKLEAAPDDAESHLTVGRFYALSKGDFLTGLPHLVRGSDATLRAIAEKEIAAPTEPLKQVELGDGWWEVAAGVTGRPHTFATRHAQLWYQTAADNITGITLTRIQSRLKPAGETATVVSGAAGATSGTGENLVAIIDFAKDSVAGKWTAVDAANGGGVTCDVSKYARLQIPYEPPEEFDFRISFTRTADDGPIALLLHARGESFGLALDIKGEARFERIDGKIAKDNPTVVPVAISNGHRYTATVQVRKDRIVALLDDKQLIEWKTDFKDLSRYSLWKLENEKLCGVGANGAKVIFHSIELIPVTGKGKPLR